MLLPQLQQTLERVRATEWSEFPPELKHLDVVVGEEDVSLAPPFAEFDTNELSLRVGNEVYQLQCGVVFSDQSGAVAGVDRVCVE